MNQTTPEHSHYALLRAGNLRLLIPQTEIGAAEHLGTRPEASGMPGLLAVPGKDDACYIVPSDTLALLESCPDDRYMTTQFKADDGMVMHWCWSEVRMLMDYTPQLHDVPEVMLHAGSPLRQYTIMAEQPVFLCSAQVLQNLVVGAGV